MLELQILIIILVVGVLVALRVTYGKLSQKLDRFYLVPENAKPKKQGPFIHVKKKKFVVNSDEEIVRRENAKKEITSA